MEREGGSFGCGVLCCGAIAVRRESGYARISRTSQPTKYHQLTERGSLFLPLFAFMRSSAVIAATTPIGGPAWTGIKSLTSSHLPTQTQHHPYSKNTTKKSTQPAPRPHTGTHPPPLAFPQNQKGPSNHHENLRGPQQPEDGLGLPEQRGMVKEPQQPGAEGHGLLGDGVLCKLCVLCVLYVCGSVRH